MINKSFRILALIALGLVVAFGILALARAISTTPFPNDKGAEWVAAIGTIGALIGTIVLATRETSRRHRDELQLAQIHAAAITFPLIRAVNQIDFIKGHLDNVFMDPSSWPNEHDLVLRSLKSIKLPVLRDIVSMIALPSGVAAKLAAARGQIEHAIEFINSLDQGDIEPEAANPSKFALELDALLSRASDLIRECIKEAQASRKALGLA